MDGDTTITLSKTKDSTYRRQIARLVSRLEADGYLIGPDAKGTGYWVKMPEIHPDKDVCGLVKMNTAFHQDGALKAHLMPWLIKHRPYDAWERRIAHQPKRPRDVISEDAEFPLPRAKPSEAGLTG